MKIIAHRGASQEYPENTLKAFARAIEIGVDAIETDVLRTADGILILHHDEADGLTSAALAKLALERLSINTGLFAWTSSTQKSCRVLNTTLGKS